MDYMIEEWRESIEAPGAIEVSNLGAVRTVDRDSRTYGRRRNGKLQGSFVQRRLGKVLSPCVARNGYLEVAVMVGGKRTKYRVHRLVGRAFVPGHFDGATIDHLDGNKLNNRADNLEWVSLSENTRRQWATGLVDLRGEGQPGAKLTKEQAAAIKVLGDHGFPIPLIAEWFGVKRATVDAIKAGRRWRQILEVGDVEN